MSTFYKRLTNFEAIFKAEGQRINYAKKQVFVRPEDDNSWVYFLDSGLVEITFSFQDGNNRLLGYFFEGTIFAKIGSFLGCKGSELEYATVKDSILYRLPQPRFFEILSQNADCSREYLEQLLRSQYLLIERVAVMGERTIDRMVIRLLLDFARYYGHPVGKTFVAEVPVTQETIARFTHATRESVSKTIRSLTQQKIITIKNKKLTIKDISALEKMLEN